MWMYLDYYRYKRLSRPSSTIEITFVGWGKENNFRVEFNKIYITVLSR